MCLEMRILCRCTDGTPPSCKPLKLRAFAAVRSCWPQEGCLRMTTPRVTRTLKRLIFKHRACRVRLTGCYVHPKKKPLRSFDLRGSVFQAWR